MTDPKSVLDGSAFGVSKEDLLKGAIRLAKIYREKAKKHRKKKTLMSVRWYGQYTRLADQFEADAQRYKEEIDGKT